LFLDFRVVGELIDFTLAVFRAVAQLWNVDNPTLNFTFREYAEVWEHNFFGNMGWPFGKCVITNEAITVHAAGRDHVHAKAELQVLRWVWLPYPYLIIISRPNGLVRYSSFQILRWSRLRDALRSAGFDFTEEIRYYSFHRVRDDKKHFGLYDPSR
jgi:hypothetical protein